jgi:hypothetical protein
VSLSRLFGGGKSARNEPPEDELLIIPVPALVAVLLAKYNEKGAALSEQEVLTCRDNAESIAMRPDVAEEVIRARGYDDLDPENIWAEWQAFLADYLANDAIRPNG